MKDSRVKKFIVMSTIIIAVMGMASCGTWKKVAYFQDKTEITSLPTPTPITVKLAAGDKIAIFVQCEDAETSELFNLSYTPRMIGTNINSRTTQGTLGYTLDENGDIDFPTIGKIHVAGKSRNEVAMIIKQELANRGQAQNAIVTVEFLDLTISILGEVKNPGRYTIDRDILTIMDAIGMAGDLTIDGEREVMVMRKENDKQVIYNIDLCQAQQMLSSPAYYLQQGDIIYVQPSSKKARTATVNGNNAFSASFWLSVATTAVTVLTFVFAYSRNN